MARSKKTGADEDVVRKSAKVTNAQPQPKRVRDARNEHRRNGKAWGKNSPRIMGEYAETNGVARWPLGEREWHAARRSIKLGEALSGYYV